MKRYSLNPSVRRRRGFTLTEVLLVLAILGVIAAMVIPNLLGAQDKANKRQSAVNIASFETIAKQYAIDHDGDWAHDANALMNPGADKDGKQLAPYMEKIPKDAWGSPLNYEYPSGKAGGDKPAIWSSGRNKTNEDGGGDDINNWNS